MPLLRRRIENLRFFILTKHLFYVIAVSEAKFGKYISDSLAQLDNYVLHRCDRRSDGGGVALHKHKSIKSTVICKSTFTWTGRPAWPEYLYCEIQCPETQPVFAGVVYRPPSAPFFGGEGNKFNEDLEYCMHQYTTKIIVY